MKPTPITPSTTVRLSETGVPQSYYSSHQESEGQSVYKCLLKKPGMEISCTYYSAQMAAMCTHLQHKHMKICVKCCLCNKRAYSTTTISLHLKTIHHDQSSEWFEPTPPLEGDIAEVTDWVLAENIHEVKNMKEEPDEEQDE